MGQGAAHGDALSALHDQDELWAEAGGCVHGPHMGGARCVGHGGTGGCAAGGGRVVVVVVVIGRGVLLRMAVLGVMPMQWAF